MEKIILGIDPGTNLMGYGLLKVVDGKAQMITIGGGWKGADDHDGCDRPA